MHCDPIERPRSNKIDSKDTHAIQPDLIGVFGVHTATRHCAGEGYTAHIIGNTIHQAPMTESAFAPAC